MNTTDLSGLEAAIVADITLCSHSAKEPLYYDEAEVGKKFPGVTFAQFRDAALSLVDKCVLDYANRDPEGILLWLDDHSTWQTSALQDAPPAPRAAPAKTASKAVVGFVYVLRSQDGLYKIGKSIDPDVRIKSLGVVLPFAITPLHIIPSQDYIAAEKRLHERFAQKRQRGEWFDLDEQDLSWLISLHGC